jgi:threonine synthase
LLFIQTRGEDKQKDKKVTFSQALLSPSASFGGLYVPEFLPKLQSDFFKTAINFNYKELCFDILKRFDIDIETSVIKEALDLYDRFDDPNEPTILTKVDNNLFINELYHGPTRAFKDMALQPFGYILSHLAKKQNKEFLILAATSGDTGPATLDTFANKQNIRVVCLYPSGGTSDVQRLQMVTNGAKNLKVIGIEGDFDDAQSALKSLLSSKEFNQKLKENEIYLSAANSVNFGRIIFQIIYHIKAYLDLIKRGEINEGEEIYHIIPSGNFGNALGAYYAKKMGVPIRKILINANSNDVLASLINDGVYDISERELKLTISPAMDILKSSNVERVLFDKFGANRTRELMRGLDEDKRYELTKEELSALREDFDAISSDDEFTKEKIKEYFLKNIIIDPHTATCFNAYENLASKDIPSVICSTAEWTKFAPAMQSAISGESKKVADIQALEFISKKAGIQITPSIKELFEKRIAHEDVVKKSEIVTKIEEFLKI